MNRFKSVRYTHVFLCVVWVLLNAFSSSAAVNAQSKKKVVAAGNELVLSLVDFGSKGDGVTDDGPAFQKALDALAQAGGGILFVPAGHYFIGSPVTKDFSGVSGSITIQGVPSATMPAPPTAGGDQLSLSLDLPSEIIPATGSSGSVFTLTNLHDLTIEHLTFIGRESVITDAFVTINLSDINSASIYHCEFYGISALIPGGNVIRAQRTDLSIQRSSFLGCTSNSAAYAPIVENFEWNGFTISNSIFLDYGQRPLFGKMGLGSPISWINFDLPAARTSESSRREVVIRDIFLDEGGYVGITAYPHRWTPPSTIDLVYISGLHMNVCNFGTAGNQFFDVKNVLIEKSYYGWSHLTGTAVDINRSEHAILDQLTFTASANLIRADVGTDRLTVINSNFQDVISLAQTTTVLETSPEEDPVQYVRQQFLLLAGREPDAASHFYWSDLLLRCGDDQNCRDASRTALSDYLKNQPEARFSLTGMVTDETGNPMSGVALNLTGSQSLTTETDAGGNFQFLDLPTSGVYTVIGSKPHYAITSQTFVNPAHSLNVSLGARRNRHSITGRITMADGTTASGIKVQLLGSASFVTTNADGEYSFRDLLESENYTIGPSSEDAVFSPANMMIQDLEGDLTADFTMKLLPVIVKIEDSQNALVLDSVDFVKEPISIFKPLGFSPDGISRVVFFITSLEGFNDPSQLLMLAEDSDGEKFPLQIEFIADVPQHSWLKQINVKLRPELKGKCVNLTLSGGELTSHAAQLCVAKD
jgi:hypothetical protein